MDFIELIHGGSQAKHPYWGTVAKLTFYKKVTLLIFFVQAHVAFYSAQSMKLLVYFHNYISKM